LVLHVSALSLLELVLLGGMLLLLSILLLWLRWVLRVLRRVLAIAIGILLVWVVHLAGLRVSAAGLL
jgi:MFS superfamily sulfate permease-like transporter